MWYNDLKTLLINGQNKIFKIEYNIKIDPKNGTHKIFICH